MNPHDHSLAPETSASALSRANAVSERHGARRAERSIFAAKLKTRTKKRPLYCGLSSVGAKDGTRIAAQSADFAIIDCSSAR